MSNAGGVGRRAGAAWTRGARWASTTARMLHESGSGESTRDRAMVAVHAKERVTVVRAMAGSARERAAVCSRSRSISSIHARLHEVVCIE